MFPNETKLLDTSGFDLTTGDSYFTILVEVFSNCILAEKIRFTNRIE